MNKNLFVYGTLMIPEIQFALLGKKPIFKTAVLKDYSLCCFQKDKLETEYPVLKFTKGKEVNGNILESLSDLDLNILSYYEGEDYCLNEIYVFISGAIHRVNTFMPKDSGLIKFGSKWNLDTFRKHHLQHHLTEIVPDTLREFQMHQTNLSI